MKKGKVGNMLNMKKELKVVKAMGSRVTRSLCCGKMKMEEKVVATNSSPSHQPHLRAPMSLCCVTGTLSHRHALRTHNAS